MVKIKTSPEINNKVAIADLNNNIIQLTQALNKSTRALAINQVPKTSSTSKSTKSSSAVSEVWNAKDVTSMRSNVGSSIIGGLTGINPAIVQKLGLDKAIGSALKNFSNTIKKKWTEAGKSSNSTKTNSAIEAHRISPITKRLDKIVGLLKNKQTTQVLEAEKKNRGILGKIFSGLLKFLGPMLKLGALFALGKTIWDGIQWLVKRFGGDPSEVTKDVAVGLAGTGAGLKGASGAANKLLRNEKAYRDALADLQADEYYKKLSPQERAKEIRRPSKKAPREFIEKIDRVNSTRRDLYKTEGVTEGQIKRASIRAGRSAEKIKDGKFVPNTVEKFKYKGRNVANNTTSKTGKVMNTLAIGLEGANTIHDIYQDIAEGKTEDVVPDALKGAATIGGMELGGTIGAKVGKGPWKIATGIAGAILGATLSEKAIKKAFPETYQNKTLEDLAFYHPEKVPRPELTDADKAGIYDPGLGDGVISHGWDLLNKYIDPVFYYDWIRGNPTYMYGHTTKELDPRWMNYVYAQGKLGNAMPTDIPRSAYLDPHGNTTFEEIYEQGLKAYKKEHPEIGVDSINTQSFTPEYGLTTDFDTPIKAADSKGDTMSSIEQNTRDTKDAVEMIVKVLQEGNDTMQSWKYNGSTSNTTSSVTAQNELTNDVPPFVTLRSIVGQGL